MDNKVIFLVGIMVLCIGFAADHGQAQTGTEGMKVPAGQYRSPYARGPAASADQLAVDPFEIDTSALPELGGGLPYPASPRRLEQPRRYTGIIKNKTRYDVSVPSANSDATLIVPAYGFIEYTAWTRRFDVTAYRDGKPFYCLKINASPHDYPYMCKRYDFMAEIVKPEPAPTRKVIKKKRRLKKKPVSEGVEGLG